MEPRALESAVAQRLERGARTLNIALTAEQSSRLLHFLALLMKWNRAYNLTAVRDPLQMVERHLLDSLAVMPYVQGDAVLDVGTGPGLPGIPLALLLPEKRFVLLDGNGKKLRFVRQAVLELGLENVQPMHARVEDYDPRTPFDTVIARAFTSLPRMLELTRRLGHAGSCLLAMKGTLPREEIERLPATLALRIIPLQLPFSQAERHLIEMILLPSSDSCSAPRSG